MKNIFLKGDMEFTIQVLIMAIFGLVVAMILFVALAGQKGEQLQTTSTTSTKPPPVLVGSFDFPFLFLFVTAIFAISFLKIFQVIA